MCVAVAASLALLAALLGVPVGGTTHAPPWGSGLARATRAIGEPPAATAWPAWPSPSHILPGQAQRQLQQLQQLSRMHLDSWARQLQLPQAPQQRDGPPRRTQPRPLLPHPAPSGTAVETADAAAVETAPEALAPAIDDQDAKTPSPPTSPREKQQGAAAGKKAISTVDREDRGPSTCVWAIVTCCQPQTSTVRYSCFELLGCPGAFWDGSPCDPAVASAALDSAARFYGHSTGTSGGSEADADTPSETPEPETA